MKVASDIPTALRVEGGAGELTLDLRDIQVTEAGSARALADARRPSHAARRHPRPHRGGGRERRYRGARRGRGAGERARPRRGDVRRARRLRYDPPIRSLLLATIVVALSASLGATASADEGWVIERFSAQIIVRQDSSILVTEQYDVDFAGLEKHGVFREIPARYDLSETHERVYELRVRSVTDSGGRAWRYERSDQGRFVRLRIGDPDRAITGKQTYRIVYEVRGALNGFENHDELYWNVNGVWPVATRQATARVQLERGDVTNAACYQGRFASTEPCRTAARAGSAEMTATRPLVPGEQMSIVVGFPKGAVAAPAMLVEEKPREPGRWWEITPAALAGAVLVLLAGLAWLASRYVSGGRDPEGRVTVAPEYAPPEDLRAAEVGLLIDENADPKDLTATIVDLAVRGYLAIEEVPPSGLLGSRDWILRRGKKSDATLAGHESALLLGLFASGNEVKLSSLKGTFHRTLEQAQRLLYRAAVERRWFPADPAKVRNAWRGIGLAVALLGGFATIALGVRWGAGLVGTALALVGVATIVTAAAMPKRTATGQELLRRTLGFRMYMDTAEADRQRFAERENIFAKYLPYAIVFGLVSKWARAFEGLDVEKAVQGWYTGSSYASFPAFSHGLAEMSSSVSSVIAATPASTTGSRGGSGFGGGGFSGGGFGGGGGGGSW